MLYLNNKGVNNVPGSAEEVGYNDTTTQLGASNVQDAIESVSSSLSNMERIVLWENPSPKTNFPSQTITLSSDNFEYMEIYCNSIRGTQASGTRIIKNVAQKGGQAHIFSVQYTSNGVIVDSRLMTSNSDTSYTFEDNYRNTSVNNDLIIPLIIYGYKQLP